MNNDFSLAAYHYDLPPENIAQHPAQRRDQSRLMILDTREEQLQHKRFNDIIDYIDSRDMLVVNDTRVFSARLQGAKETGGKVEVFLLNFPEESESEPGTAEVEALLKSSKRPRQFSTINISDQLSCKVLELREGGKALLRLHYTVGQQSLVDILEDCGQVPLPPYIQRNSGTTREDQNRYQTVYARQPGAVAAPTAGLHFTDNLLQALNARGVELGTITLHVGYGTFAPVRTEHIKDHVIHSEYVTVPEGTVNTINAVKARGGRIWAVGTTTVRALEFAAGGSELKAVSDWCDLYIYPGYTFRVIDNLITNFHLPGSSLMFLVAALCGRKNLLNSYQVAIEKGYRFYSYGDAMAVLRK